MVASVGEGDGPGSGACVEVIDMAGPRAQVRTADEEGVAAPAHRLAPAGSD